MDTADYAEATLFKKMYQAWFILGALSTVTVILSYINLSDKSGWAVADMYILIATLIIIAAVSFALYYQCRYNMSQKAIDYSLIILAIVLIIAMMPVCDATATYYWIIIIVTFIFSVIMFLINVIYIGAKELHEGSTKIVTAPLFIAAMLTMLCIGLLGNSSAFNVDTYSNQYFVVGFAGTVILFGWLTGCVLVAAYILFQPGRRGINLMILGAIANACVGIAYSGPPGIGLKVILLASTAFLVISVILARICLSKR